MKGKATKNRSNNQSCCAVRLNDDNDIDARVFEIISSRDIGGNHFSTDADGREPSRSLAGHRRPVLAVVM